MKSSIVFIFLLCSLLPAGQKLLFDHLTIEQGLSQSTIYCILQDNQGFLWFGTQDGLNKFDGYTFTVYNHYSQGKNEIPHNEIRTLLQDRNGCIWIGTWGGGLARFDPATGGITVYNYPKAISHNKVTALYEDDNNQLWIGTSGGGLNSLDTKSGQIRHFFHLPDNTNSLLENHIEAIAADGNGYLWLATHKGIDRFDPRTLSFIHYPVEKKGDPQASVITSLVADCPDTVWFGTNGYGAGYLDIPSGKIEFINTRSMPGRRLSDDQVFAVYRSSDNRLWIGTSNGLNILDTKTGLIEIHTSRGGHMNSLSQNDVRSIFEDNSGLFWIGTDGGGLNIYNPNRPAFSHYRHEDGNPNSLSDNYVWAIYEDNKQYLWLGTDYGLNRLDRNSGKFKVWLHDPSDPNSIGNNEILAIYKEPLIGQSVYWIGTWGAGMDRFDLQANKFTHFRHDPENQNSVCDNYIRLIYEDPQAPGRILWIGTKYGGLDRFDIKTRRFTHYRFDPSDSGSLSDNSILSVLRDFEGNLWIGTWGGGLNRLDESTGTFIKYRHNPNDTTSIRSNVVSCIYEDHSGNLWLGTHGGGLNLFDRESKSFTSWQKSDGLPNNVIYGILEDEYGYLWISTNHGISRFDPQAKGKTAFKNYERRDGLQSNEFNNRAFHACPHGELFFGGINGFNAFFPGLVRENPFKPPVVLTDFKLFNRSVLPDSNSVLQKHISFTDTIQLSHSQNVFSIEFSGLSYSASVKNQYAYKLEGFDQDWIHVPSSQRFASYTNLDPGTYSFKVRASNNDGVWNIEGTRLLIIIQPPFWKTPWFYFIATISIFALVAVVFEWRTRSLKAQQRHLEREVTHRTAELNRQKVELEKALSKVKQLGGLLPICSSCKKIRDDKGYWNQIETYISEHSEADFSHSLCPDCLQQLYPDIYPDNPDSGKKDSLS